MEVNGVDFLLAAFPLTKGNSRFRS